MEKKEIILSQRAVIVNEEGKILTLRRTETAPFYPLTWDLPGGIWEVGEDARESILREVKEETGLEPGDIRIFDIHAHISESDRFSVSIGWKAVIVSGDVLLSYEHDEFKWVTKEEFVELMKEGGFRSLVQFVKNAPI